MLGRMPGAEEAKGPPKDSSEIVCINAIVDTAQSSCLNEDSAHPMIHLYTDSDTQVLRSDCDEQLLMNIYFSQPVKIHHLVIQPGDG